MQSKVLTSTPEREITLVKLKKDPKYELGEFFFSCLGRVGTTKHVFG